MDPVATVAPVDAAAAAPVVAPAPVVAAPVATPAPAPAAAPIAAAPAPAAAPAAPVAAPIVEDPALVALRAQVAALSGVVRAQADDALAAVPEGVRRSVESIAGDDPARRLEVLRTMRANGLVASPAAPAQVPPGASTMPAPGAPSPAAMQSPDALALAQYEQLRGVAPIRAAAYLEANGAAIARARAARPS